MNSKISLVLGGGGLRWCAHVGVYRRMCEYDIHPDEIIGTSIGAIIGAFIAFGLSADDIDALIASIPKTILMTPDLRTGLLSQRWILNYFAEFLGKNTRIEDAKIPLKIIVTNFDSGQKEVLTQGPLLSAIAASACLPSLFAPVNIWGNRYIDGGIVDNLAVSEAQYDRIIAVSVVADPSTQKRKKQNIPIKIFTIHRAYEDLVQSFKIMLMQNELAKLWEKREKIILIKPNVSDIGLLQMSMAQEAVKRGYKAGEMLENL